MVATTLTRSAARALTHVRYTPGITRHELAEALGVSVTTVNPLISTLLAGGSVVEVIPAKLERPAVGRPRAGLVTPGPADTIAAVMWSHGVLDSAIATFDHQIVWRRRVSVDGLPTTPELVDAVRRVLDADAAPAPSLGVPGVVVLGLPAPYEPGVGLGSADAHGKDSGSGFGSWFSRDPRAILSEEFELPVIVENDANLGALGETHLGAGVGESTAIYVKLSGHGIGAGLTINGGLFSGSHGFAGEIAHVRVDDDSPTICACGSRGCLEEKIGPNMLRQLHANYGASIDYSDLLAMVRSGVPGPVRLLKDAGRVAGRALADICAFLNPGVLILDAGSPEASLVLIGGVREQIEQSTPPFARHGLRLVPARLGDDAPIVGAVHRARVSLLRDAQ